MYTAALVVFWGLQAAAQKAVIVSPNPAPGEPVRYGIQQLTQALQAEGWEATSQYGKPASQQAKNLEIVVTPYSPGDAHSAGLEMLRDVVYPEPESMTVLKFPRDFGMRVYAVGSDAAGAMYAALAVAEQIQYGGGRSVPARITETRLRPSIPVRGIKVMLHHAALLDPLSWVHSHAYWRGLLDRLAHNRFNYLALHGVYDLNTNQFQNLYRYFYPNPENSNAAVNLPAAGRIRRSVKQILQLAQQRGIKVSLHNVRTPGMNAAQSNDVNAFRMLEGTFGRLLKEYPTLNGIGVRVGYPEYQPAAANDATAFQPLKNHPNRPLVFLHPGGAQPPAIRQLIENYEGSTVLELNFNGGYLGLPYPVTGDRSAEWNRASYQSYFDASRKYGILFQINSAGSHRIFPWGGVDFIHQTLRSVTKYQANGFVVEPISTYAPKTDAYTNHAEANLSYFQWTHERDWYWYVLWGRMAYNLDIEYEVFKQRFRHRFGQEAGDKIWQALQNISAVIPAINAAAQRRPERSAFSPELEPPFTLNELQEAQPLDPFNFQSIREEAQTILTGRPEGRPALSQWLGEAVEQAQKAVRQMDEADPIRDRPDDKSPLLDEHESQIVREWQAWQLDFEALAALAGAWHHQLNAALSWNLFLNTADAPSLITAVSHLRQARQHWAQVQQKTARHYRPLFSPLSNTNGQYHWKNVQNHWQEDIQHLTQMYNQWLNQNQWRQGYGHLPTHRAQPGESILLTYAIPPQVNVEQVMVNYQNSYGISGQVQMGPSTVEGVYFAQIPSAVVKEGIVKYFFLAAIDGETYKINSPTSGEPYIVSVTQDDEPSKVELWNPEIKTNHVFITAEFTDASGIFEARLYWKPFESSQPWQIQTMQRSEGKFHGSFPYNGSGAQYAIEVSDNQGNARRFPSVFTGMPYLLILPSP